MRRSKLLLGLVPLTLLLVATAWAAPVAAEPETLHAYENTVGGVKVRLLLTGEPGAANISALEEAGTRLSALVSEAAGDLGRSPDEMEGEVVIVFAFGEGASVDSETVMAIIPADPSSNILGTEATAALAAETMDALLDIALGGRRAQLPAWLADGSGLYYSMLLPYQAGFITADGFWDRLSLAYASYVEEGGTAEEGAVILAAVEQRLRESSGGRLSLEDMWLELTGRDGALGPEAVRESLESLTGTSWEKQLREWTEGAEPINASTFSTLKSAPVNEPGTAGKVEDSGAPRGYAWLFIGLGALIILAIPILLEPYTLKPRK